MSCSKNETSKCFDLKVVFSSKTFTFLNPIFLSSNFLLINPAASFGA